MYKYTIQ